MKRNADGSHWSLVSRPTLAATLTIAVIAAVGLLIGFGRASVGRAAVSAAQYQYTRTNNIALCQNGGWEALMDSTGTAFSNPGECVHDAATGRPLYRLATLSLQLCAVQLAEGICVNGVGSGLNPGGTVSIEFTKNGEPAGGCNATYTDGSWTGQCGSFSSVCVPGDVFTATAFATSAPSISIPVAPGVTIRSNTVTQPTTCT